MRWLATAGVDAFILPKIEQRDAVVTVAALLDGLGLPDTRLIPIIESARGVLNAPLIAAAPRVLALAIGLEDYIADIGAQRRAAGRESEWACSMIVNTVRAAGVMRCMPMWMMWPGYKPPHSRPQTRGRGHLRWPACLAGVYRSVGGGGEWVDGTLLDAIWQTA